MNGKECELDLQGAQEVIAALGREIDALNARIQKSADYIDRLVLENDLIVKENYALIRDVAKTEQKLKSDKRWGIGAFAGYGLYADDKVRVGSMVGIGVTYDFLRF